MHYHFVEFELSTNKARRIDNLSLSLSTYLNMHKQTSSSEACLLFPVHSTRLHHNMSSLYSCCSCRTTLVHPQAASAVQCNAFAIARRPAAAALRRMSTELYGLCRHVTGEVGCRPSFLLGTTIHSHPKLLGIVPRGKGLRTTPTASWLTTSHIASNAFTWGTVAVLPFYSLMVVAPNSALTRKVMTSSAPYVPLGVLYACLLYLSWTPETMRLMFASEYWLPELESIAKLFSNEMTLASAWIHLLIVDLFAARQVFLDGRESKVETRHSVSLCLLFCPIGILSHVVTKFLNKETNAS